MSLVREKILNFENVRVDASIISFSQIELLVDLLLNTIEDNIDGDVVELGCYVGESSKYLMKTLIETSSDKNLYVYDSFEGLPELSEIEKNTGWRAGTLKTTQQVLIQNFQKNNLPIPIINKNWFKDIPNENLPEKISFAFLDGDFYTSIYDSLEKVWDKVSDGGYICFHDYDRHDLPGVKLAIDDFFKSKNVENTTKGLIEHVGVYRKNKKIDENYVVKNGGVTLVTGLWDLGRSNLTEGWSRSYDHYLDKFSKLLEIKENLIIFGDEELEKFVFSKRSGKNTQFILRDLSWFKNNEFFDKIQKIRNNPNWFEQVGWLKDSTQARLELYNPLVMSKVFLLHDAKILDKFNSEYMFWIDAGLSNTVHMGYFTHDNVLEKLPKYVNNFHFICFPYETNTEIHGFEISEMNNYSGSKVNKVARGGFFGGLKESISEINSIYYGLLQETLNNNLMGTEESIFTIMTYKYPQQITYSEINGNGLVSKFFEDLKNDNLVVKSEKIIQVEDDETIIENDLNINKVSLYVITFNSPNQFETLLKSMEEYDINYIKKTKKYLLDNSTDSSTTPRYIELCEKYGFEHIKKDNLGICGGRQWIAEHFDESDSDYMLFFEDDMFFYPKEGEVCRNGFNRYIKDLYKKSLKIIHKNNFDFLKLNYSEFFGDNGTQWSWYNVPQNVREKFWPQKRNLPRIGLDPNAPRTNFKNIFTLENLPYVTGEVYYCNWPQIVSKSGNKKMFLDTKWARPHEQTWMSHMYQLTKSGELRPSLLLLTPTEHNRFDFYDGKLRKES